MLRWIENLFSRATLSMNDDERQNLTTLSMMGGAMALTVAIGLLVYVLRYSWPEVIVAANAPAIITGLIHIIFGCLALMAIMIVAQAVIAIGGKMKASFGGASVEAEAEKNRDLP